MLEDAWDNHTASGNAFRDELRLNERAVGALIANGVLASVSKNSASQSYALNSGASNLTVKEIAGAWRDLINAFDWFKQVLVDNGTASPTDDDVYLQMRANIVPRYSRTISLLSIREGVAA